jgi:hypothetical protein
MAAQKFRKSGKREVDYRKPKTGTGCMLLVRLEIRQQVERGPLPGLLDLLIGTLIQSNCASS